MNAPETLTITVRRTGGLAGIGRTWRVTESGDSAASWWPLVESCPWGDGPGSSAGADRFVYSIRVELLPSGSPLEATLPEGSMTGPWKDLVSRVREASS